MNIDSLIWRVCAGQCCGVYQLRLAGEIQYIGRAFNVRRRVGEHRWERRIEFDEALIADVAREELLEVERALIRHHRPPFNKKLIGHPPPNPESQRRFAEAMISAIDSRLKLNAVLRKQFDRNYRSFKNS